MARILIVDDEPDILLLMRVTLEAAGYETVLAADGDVALQHLRDATATFDLVLLDLMMPVVDGWGVLDGLADMPVRPPVVVLSAKSAGRDIARAIEMGAADYVIKPFELPDLLARIGAAVGAGRPGVGGGVDA